MLKITRSHYGGAGGGDASDPVKWFRGKVVRVEQGAEEVLEQSMGDGAATMKEMIRSRPARTSGPNGRYRTGDMYNDVKSRVYPATEKGTITGRFGWIDRRREYYGLQEGGFQHTSGVEVEGMYAMVDAAELAFREFQRGMDQVVKDA